tara:strand:- start:264 stop:509 length:246 start_codon:yes stop_codon:yes gene_type:complete
MEVVVVELEMLLLEVQEVRVVRVQQQEVQQHQGKEIMVVLVMGQMDGWQEEVVVQVLLEVTYQVREQLGLLETVVMDYLHL